MADKLKSYKASIQKVGKMLTDPVRTRFVAICIAEYLSVNETDRLLMELKKCKVRASAVVVNQLVRDSLSKAEMGELEDMVEVGGFGGKTELLKKTISACKLTTSRRGIQERYLKELRGSVERIHGKEHGLAIVEVPLLPAEVTGPSAILSFSRFLVDGKKAWVEESSNLGGEMKALSRAATSDEKPLYDKADLKVSFGVGDRVRIGGLVKKADYNGFEGVITTFNSANGRFGVEFMFEDKEDIYSSGGEKKSVSLLPGNLEMIQKGTEPVILGKEPAAKKLKGGENGHSNGAPTMPAAPAMNAMKEKLLADPEIKAMIATNPNIAKAVDEVSVNPMAALGYMGNPEYGPFIAKCMGKLGMGGM